MLLLMDNTSVKRHKYVRHISSLINSVIVWLVCIGTRGDMFIPVKTAIRYIYFIHDLFSISHSLCAKVNIPVQKGMGAQRN